MSLLNIASVLLEFRLLPEDASTVAGKVDALYYFLVGVSTLFTSLIFLLVILFAIKYRLRPSVEQPAHSHVGNLKLELLWIAVPFVLVMIMFGWGAKLYVEIRTPPPDAMEVFVVAKQWMWKLQHAGGRREINELHIPVNQPVQLKMISEDVIHSFYVPAFRVKQDVLPGYYTTLWFEAHKAGEYHLFCAEYCGTEHSSMIGRIIAMPPDDFQHWLTGGAPAQTMAEAGRDLFTGRGSCQTCHSPGSGARGPDLANLFGSTVRLQEGKTVLADENYIRESILRPGSKLVFGYENIMPPYEGQLSEEEVLQLIAYIRGLNGGQAESPAGRPAAGPETQPSGFPPQPARHEEISP